MYNHLGVLLIFLILCYHKMPLQTGHVEQRLEDQINIYTSLQLHSIRENNYMSNLDNNICSKIKIFGIKRIFRGKFIKLFSPIYHKILTDLELDIKHISDWMHQNHLKMNNAKNRVYNIWNKIMPNKAILI